MKYYLIFLSFILLFTEIFCSKKKDLLINVYGLYKDNPVNAISFNGYIFDLPVYQVPLDKNKKPEDVVYYINLVPKKLASAVKSIALAMKENKPEVLEFQGREYVSLFFYFDSFIRKYLVDISSYFEYSESLSGLEVRSNIIELIGKLEIFGYKKK